MRLFQLVRTGALCFAAAVSIANGAVDNTGPSTQPIGQQLADFSNGIHTFRASIEEDQWLAEPDGSHHVPIVYHGTYEIAFSGDDVFYQYARMPLTGDTWTIVRKNGVVKDWQRHAIGAGFGSIGAPFVATQLVREIGRLLPWHSPADRYDMDLMSNSIRAEKNVVYQGIACVRSEWTSDKTSNIAIIARDTGLAMYTEVQRGALTHVVAVESFSSGHMKVPLRFSYQLIAPPSVCEKICGVPIPPDLSSAKAIAFVQRYQFSNILVNQPIDPKQFEMNWQFGTEVTDHKTGVKTYLGVEADEAARGLLNSSQQTMEEAHLQKTVHDAGVQRDQELATQPPNSQSWLDRWMVAGVAILSVLALAAVLLVVGIKYRKRSGEGCR
jgi:hypothetical protein